MRMPEGIIPSLIHSEVPVDETWYLKHHSGSCSQPCDMKNIFLRSSWPYLTTCEIWSRSENFFFKRASLRRKSYEHPYSDFQETSVMCLAYFKVYLSMKFCFSSTLSGCEIWKMRFENPISDMVVEFSEKVERAFSCPSETSSLIYITWVLKNSECIN